MGLQGEGARNSINSVHSERGRGGGGMRNPKNRFVSVFWPNAARDKIKIVLCSGPRYYVPKYAMQVSANGGLRYTICNTYAIANGGLEWVHR